MRVSQTYGLVLYNRNYREDDKLVKIFTETEGKRMFFVKHASKSKFNAVLQPLTIAHFILKINDNGLSNISGVSLKSFSLVSISTISAPTRLTIGS